MADILVVEAAPTAKVSEYTGSNNFGPHTGLKRHIVADSDKNTLVMVDPIAAVREPLMREDGRLTTLGTAEAEKPLIADSNLDVTGLRHMTITGNFSPATVAGVPPTERTLTAISNAQLQALAGTPVAVVPAPAAGKYIQVLFWRCRMIFGTAALDDAAADGNLILLYSGGATIDAMEADGLVDSAATTQGLSWNLTELLVAESAVDATAVEISNDGAEFTVVGGGDGTMEVEVFFRTLDTNPS